MTSAAQIGIDSCPIEGFDKEEVDSLLRQEGIIQGDNFEASVMVAFGYRKEEFLKSVIKQDRLWIQLLNGLSNIAHTNNAPNSWILILKNYQSFFLCMNLIFHGKIY